MVDSPVFPADIIKLLNKTHDIHSGMLILLRHVTFQQKVSRAHTNIRYSICQLAVNFLYSLDLELRVKIDCNIFLLTMSVLYNMKSNLILISKFVQQQ